MLEVSGMRTIRKKWRMHKSLEKNLIFSLFYDDQYKFKSNNIKKYE